MKTHIMAGNLSEHHPYYLTLQFLYDNDVGSYIYLDGLKKFWEENRVGLHNGAWHLENLHGMGLIDIFQPNWDREHRLPKQVKINSNGKAQIEANINPKDKDEIIALLKFIKPYGTHVDVRDFWKDKNIDEVDKLKLRAEKSGLVERHIYDNYGLKITQLGEEILLNPDKLLDDGTLKDVKILEQGNEIDVLMKENYRLQNEYLPYAKKQAQNSNRYLIWGVILTGIMSIAAAIIGAREGFRLSQQTKNPEHILIRDTIQVHGGVSVSRIDTIYVKPPKKKEVNQPEKKTP